MKTQNFLLILPDGSFSHPLLYLLGWPNWLHIQMRIEALVVGCHVDMMTGMNQLKDLGIFMNFRLVGQWLCLQPVKSKTNQAVSKIRMMATVHGLIMNGTFLKESDPMKPWAGFQEGNGFQYTWYVPYDVTGLIGLVGIDLFNDRLKTMFNEAQKSIFGGGILNFKMSNVPNRDWGLLTPPPSMSADDTD